MLGYEYNVQPYFLQEFMTPSRDQVGLAHELWDALETLARGAADR